jgi:hypothetical protein
MNETPLYAPPASVSLGQSLYLIFSHYCSPWKSSFSESAAHDQSDAVQNSLQSMDSTSFVRMCREAPDLDQFIGRTEIDLIYSKSKPTGTRRLNFEHFLDSLLQLAIRIYPEEDPRIALANFLARFIFALFDQPPTQDGVVVIDKILNELALENLVSVTPVNRATNSSPTGQSHLHSRSYDHSTLYDENM